MNEDLHVPATARTRHIYMPGKTQSGKSTLLANQILADINFGRGVCVMDAKTDLVTKVLEWIPEHRKDDVIYIDRDISIALDFMSYQAEHEKEKIIDEIEFFYSKNISPESMPNIRSNLDNVVNALLYYNENPGFKDGGALDPLRKATFLDIYYFLMDADRRKEIVDGIIDEELREYWKTPDNLPKGEDLRRLTSRMTKFKNSPRLRKIFDVPNPKLNIAEAIKERKIILVELGDLTSTQITFATLLLSKIRQAFDRNMSMKIPDEERIPFYLYCDEFHLFQTSDFADMLSRAGGLNLCLTLANQYPSQVKTAGLWDAIYKNVHTYFLFQLDPEDTARFKPYFPPPVFKPDRSRERRRLMDEYNDVHEKIKEFESLKPTSSYQYPVPRYTESEANAIMKQSERLYEQRRRIKKQIKRIDEEVETTEIVPDFVSELLRMPQGQAIYIPIDGTGQKVATPPPLPTHNPDSCAQYIKDTSEHNYACQTVDRLYHQRNASSSTGSSSEKDGGGPNKTTDVPSDKNKAKGARTPR